MSKRQAIRLEPREAFDPCVVRVMKDGRPVYSWQLLVNACMEFYGLDEYEAMEWVDYNIVGLEPMGMKVIHSVPPTRSRPRKKRGRSL